MTPAQEKFNSNIMIRGVHYYLKAYSGRRHCPLIILHTDKTQSYKKNLGERRGVGSCAGCFFGTATGTGCFFGTATGTGCFFGTATETGASPLLVFLFLHLPLLFFSSRVSSIASPLLVFLFLQLPLLFFSSRVSSIASSLLVFLFLHLPLLFSSSCFFTCLSSSSLHVSSFASSLHVFLQLPLLFSCFQTCLMAFAWHVTILVLPAICVWVGRRRVMVMISYRGEWWVECQV